MAVEYLNLICLTAFFIAIKLESRVVSVDSIVRMCSKKFTHSQIRQAEVEILKVIDFKIGKPLPIEFLRRFSTYTVVHLKKIFVVNFCYVVVNLLFKIL